MLLSLLFLSIYQFLRDVSAYTLFAECYLEIFLSVLAAGIPLLGCVSFYHQIKGNSGVLTFIQSEGRLAHKTLWCTVCK